MNQGERMNYVYVIVNQYGEPLRVCRTKDIAARELGNMATLALTSGEPRASYCIEQVQEVAA